jgi:hypothetical protein
MLGLPSASQVVFADQGSRESSPQSLALILTDPGAGIETVVIVKEKCTELIQCQKT